MDTLAWLWLGAIIVFGIIEALTVNLVSIWFMFGSIVALISKALGFSFPIQIVVFIVVSFVLLIFTAPIVRRYINKNKTATNLDAIIGKQAKVTEDIDNDKFTGAVYIDGKTWTARSADNEIFHEGEYVIVKKIEGVKAYVEKINT